MTSINFVRDQNAQSLVNIFTLLSRGIKMCANPENGLIAEQNFIHEYTRGFFKSLERNSTAVLTRFYEKLRTLEYDNEFLMNELIVLDFLKKHAFDSPCKTDLVAFLNPLVNSPLESLNSAMLLEVPKIIFPDIKQAKENARDEIQKSNDPTSSAIAHMKHIAAWKVDAMRYFYLGDRKKANMHIQIAMSYERGLEQKCKTERIEKPSIESLPEKALALAEEHLEIYIQRLDQSFICYEDTILATSLLKCALLWVYQGKSMEIALMLMAAVERYNQRAKEVSTPYLEAIFRQDL